MNIQANAPTVEAFGDYTDSRLIAHERAMANLSAKLDHLTTVVPPGSKIVILDYPVHFNAGDMLINLGTEVFFRRHRCRVVSRLSLFDLCVIDWNNRQGATLKPDVIRYINTLDSQAILVMQGGGNFGDIYPEFQALREQVASHFPQRRIVVLPQSMHFQNPAIRREKIEALVSHKDIHLFFRDRESLEAVREVSPQHGTLLPDMAHALWRDDVFSAPCETGSGTLVLRRADEEATDNSAGSFQQLPVDWPDLITPLDTFQFRLLRKSMYADFDRSRRLPAWLWYKLRDRVVRRAQTLFAKHEEIVTDRLHGLILATLLSKRVNYLDNSYGKLSRYVGVWMADSPLIQRVDRR